MAGGDTSVNGAPAGVEDRYVAIAVNERVVTIPVSLTRDYWLTGNPDLRRRLTRAIETVVPNRRVELHP